ncbi:MAG: hypothetical protein FWF76_01105 [Oscillospiraceae bacterium]|nr:hypothetical protein [Oscillospiraceae bacterium]
MKKRLLAVALVVTMVFSLTTTINATQPSLGVSVDIALLESMFYADDDELIHVALSFFPFNDVSVEGILERIGSRPWSRIPNASWQAVSFRATRDEIISMFNNAVIKITLFTTNADFLARQNYRATFASDYNYDFVETHMSSNLFLELLELPTFEEVSARVETFKREKSEERREAHREILERRGLKCSCGRWEYEHEFDFIAELEIYDALQILRYLVGLSNSLDSCDFRRAAIISDPDNPTIADALQILRYLVDLPSALD